MRKLELKYYSHQKMQEKFSEAMGDAKERDYFYCLACGANFTKRQDDCNCNDYESERWIILPLPIDPENPERGLWGMVDWEKFDLFKSLTANIFTICCISDFAFKFASRCITLALLKALAYQWRVEVEG